MFFYYRKGLRGPTPGKSTDRPASSSINGHIDPLVGEPVKVTEADFALPLDILARMYPAPVSKESTS